MTGNEEGKKQVIHIVRGVSNNLVIIGTAGYQVSITTKLVSRPYLGVQVKKTKDAVAVSLR